MSLLKTMPKATSTIHRAKILSPNSLLDNFCRALHPDLDLSSTCYTWFQQATQHCTELVLRQQRAPYFWMALQSFIFPNRETSLLSQKIPISIHPNRLSASDCEAFFFDIVNDYVAHAPAYAPASITNSLLWQSIYSLLGVLSLGLLMIFIIISYRKFVESLDSPKDVVREEDQALLCEKYNATFINRKPCQSKIFQRVMEPKKKFSSDGIPTIALKVSSKLNFIDSIVASTDISSVCLHRLQELNPQLKSEYKSEMVSNMLRFMSNDTRKLELMMLFDDEPIHEEIQRKYPSKMFAGG
ncbi:PREDICTED: uncharacterized protein LOC108354803, partial [Rhagoletis zephyria]|uniref:uncharacterized protein LOC108354803 n=1 Tax=Rhagoletis zephyria TaxID=28612 RepID=UPI0008114A62